MIDFGGVRKKCIIEFMNDNPTVTGYIVTGPALRYTQILLAQACEELGKTLECFTARLTFNSLIDQLEKYKNTTLHDKYSSLADAARDAKKKVSDVTVMWSDQHIDYMVKYLTIPDMKVCWMTHGTGTFLRAMLKANPTTIFKCVDAHLHPGLNQCKYPDDYKRISTIPFTFNPAIKDTSYNCRLFHNTKKITNDEHIVIG